MKTIILAFSFLTILPVGRNIKVQPAEMAKSVAWFPLVGLFLGFAAAFLGWFTYNTGLGLAGDVLMVLILVVLTGGLHQDGLMDTADGVFCNGDRDKRLVIMRDSRVGAMGVQAALLVLLLKTAALFDITMPEKIIFVLLAPMVARLAMAIAIVQYPYARANGGLGSLFAQKAGAWQLVTATITVLVLIFILGQFIHLWIVVTAVVLSVLASLLIAKHIATKLGGLTGDTYGAICELTETVVLLLGALLCPV